LNYGNLNDTTMLVYDFNIEEGDTFIINEYESMRVDSIRFIEWGGTNRKHWYFNYYASALTWVEDVGNLDFFVYSVPLVGATNRLLCFKENGNLIYQNPDYNSCYIATSADLIKENSEKGICIFQSENGQIVIKNQISQKGIIDFYTIDGRKIKELKLESENTLTELNNTGIIIYKFTNLTGMTQAGKFLNIIP